MARVALNIARKLGYPVAVIAGRQLSPITAFVAVPEASVDEDHFAKTREDEVGSAWQFSYVQPVTIAVRVNDPAHGDLRARIEFFDTRHALREREFWATGRSVEVSGDRGKPLMALRLSATRQLDVACSPIP